MIRSQSDDPDVVNAARTAGEIVDEALRELAQPSQFDYGGHELSVTDYDMCSQCTQSIAEAQYARTTLQVEADKQDDAEVREHIEIAAKIFELEAEIAVLRAELHSGQSSEPILNSVLGYIYDRKIHDSYGHSHSGDAS